MASDLEVSGGHLFRARMVVQDLTLGRAEAEDGTPLGTVKALVSAYDHEYQIGEKLFHTITAGAFKAYEGNPVPLFWAHNWDETEQTPIGVGVATETDDGLVVAGDIWLDIPAGLAVYRANVAGAVTEWSIGYGVLAASRLDGLKGGNVMSTGRWSVEEGDLVEASSVLRGANRRTRTLETAAGETPQPQETESPEEPPEVPDPEVVARLMARRDFRDLYRQD